MKKKSVISLIIVCSFFAWIIWWAIGASFVNSNSKNSINDLSIKDISSIEEKYSKINNINSNNNSDSYDLEEKIIDVTRKSSLWIVSIVVKKDLPIYKTDPWWFFRQPIWTVKEKVGWWTGFFITKDWKIITNKHVVIDRDAEYTIITSTWDELEAKVIAMDPLTDLAILQINAEGLEDEITTLSFVDNSNEVKIGQFTLAIWNKLWEFDNSVSLWLVSWKNRIIREWEIDLSNLIQTDADIHPGNSWWPLMNLEWKVIWINTAIIQTSDNIWFAIQISKDKISYILESIEKYWDIKRPYIWMAYFPNSKWIQERYDLKTDKWIYIINEPWAIEVWSNAEKAWLKPGYIITEVDDIEIDYKNTLSSIIQSKFPWEKIKLKVIKPEGTIERIELILWEK